MNLASRVFESRALELRGGKKFSSPFKKKPLRARARAWHNEMFEEFHLWAVAYICWTVLKEDGKFVYFLLTSAVREVFVGWPGEGGGGLQHHPRNPPPSSKSQWSCNIRSKKFVSSSPQYPMQPIFELQLAIN